MKYSLKYMVSGLLFLCFIISCTQRTKRSVTINFTVWVNTPDQLKTYETLIENYEQENPDVEIFLINTPYNGYRQKILTMSAGGNIPDIISINNEMFPPFAEKDIFLDLDDLIKKDRTFDVKEFYPVTINAFAYKNRMLGIPRDFGVFVMYYNKNLFDQSGVPYPPKDKSWTWAEFLRACKKLTRDNNGDGIIDQYGTLIQSWMPWWAMYIWQNGGDVLNPQRTQCVLDSARAKEAMRFVADLVLKHKVSPSLDMLAEEGVLPMVQTGKIATFFIGPWERRNFRMCDFDWDVAPMIKGKKIVSPLFVDGYAISKTAKHPEKAWHFIKYIISEKGMSEFTKLGFATPARKKLAESDVFLEPDKKPRNAVLFLTTLPYGRMLPVIPQWDEMGGIIVRKLELILNREKPYPVEKGLDEITHDVNKLLRKKE